MCECLDGFSRLLYFLALLLTTFSLRMYSIYFVSLRMSLGLLPTKWCNFSLRVLSSSFLLSFFYRIRSGQLYKVLLLFFPSLVLSLLEISLDVIVGVSLVATRLISYRCFRWLSVWVLLLPLLQGNRYILACIVRICTYTHSLSNQQKNWST